MTEIQNEYIIMTANNCMKYLEEKNYIMVKLALKSIIACASDNNFDPFMIETIDKNPNSRYHRD